MTEDDEGLDGIREFIELIKGGAQSSSIIVNGILNLIGKWIDAFGAAVNAAGGASPAGVVALAGFVVLNITALAYFVKTEPYRTVLQRAKVLDLLNAMISQMANIAKDVQKFLTQPSSGAGGPNKPDITIQPQGGGPFCILNSPQEWVQLVQSITGFPTVGQEQCYPDRATRDAQLAALQADSSKTWYWSFTAVDH
jgi:hypothetical protein